MENNKRLDLFNTRPHRNIYFISKHQILNQRPLLYRPIWYLVHQVDLLRPFHKWIVCAKAPLRISKKGKNKKYGVFSCTAKLLKLAFLSSLTRKYVLWKGFYHDFITKKASRGFASPPDPTKGLFPLDPPLGALPPGPPRFPCPPHDLPWRRPWLDTYYSINVIMEMIRLVYF